jgi:hypothetical protein
MREWKDAFADEMRMSVSRILNDPQNPAFADLMSAPRPAFSILPSRERLLQISAMGVSTWIAPGWIYVDSHAQCSVDDFPGPWPISGGGDEILENPEWDYVSQDERLAARWHRRLLDDVLRHLHRNFVNAVTFDAAYIMARKNSVLAPFERVTWEQWQFFRLEEPPQVPPPDPAWCDPKESNWVQRARILTTAIGPAGERLFEIHAAPGATDSEDDDAEQKSSRWLQELLRDFPDRPPKPLHKLAEDATSQFCGLSLSSFRRSLFHAQMITGNRSWRKAGRHPNPPGNPRKRNKS